MSGMLIVLIGCYLEWSVFSNLTKVLSVVEGALNLESQDMA